MESKVPQDKDLELPFMKYALPCMKRCSSLTKYIRLGIAKINFVSALGLQFILCFVYNKRFASA